MIQQVGIFGGSFNPIHFGHIHSLNQVMEKLGFSKIRVIPTAQNPHKSEVVELSHEHRVEMLRRTFELQKELFVVDECEVRRGGTSYTLETLNFLQKEHKEEEFSLIIGMDQFEKFQSWYGYEKIFEMVQLVITSRSGSHLPQQLLDIPLGLRPYIDGWSGGNRYFENGKKYCFCSVRERYASLLHRNKKSF